MNLEPSIFLDAPLLRVARAQDGDSGRIADFYLNLSLDSRYQRFFSHHPSFMPEELTRLSHPDREQELCLIAIAGRGPDAIVVGDLRCVAARRESAAGRAWEREGEIALVVADGWRRRGIGRLLLCGLIANARAEGYTGLLAYVASSNPGMLKLLHEFDFHFEPLPGSANMRVLRRALARGWDDAGWQTAQPQCRDFEFPLSRADAAANVAAAR